MNSLKEKDRQKMVQDRCQNLLNTMLRDEDNKYCVDCDAKGPRWASWNLGIFLCIRCAGIHRNLGVHISKVKSVNLDTWTPEQVTSLEQMGNSRARAVYEANLPDSFRRPQTDSGLESFIRAKYETKKYIAQEWVPPPLPKVNWDKEIEEEIQRTRRQRRENKTSTTVPVPKKVENVIPQPLPKPSPKLQRSGDRVGTSNPPTNAPSSSPKATPTTDLLGLDTPVSESGQEDIFSSFLSAESVPAPPPIAPTEAKRTEEEEQFFKQSATTLNAAQDKKMSTDSILALYSKSTPSQPPMAYPQPHVFQTYQPNGVIPPSTVPSLSSNPFYSLAASGNQAPGHFPVQHNMGVGMPAPSAFSTHQLSSQLPTAPTPQTGTLSSNLWH